MEYRIVFKSKHEELFEKAKEEIVKILDSYGIPPNVSEKRYSSSYELRIESPVAGRKNLDDLMDEDGNVDLNIEGSIETIINIPQENIGTDISDIGH